MATARDLIKRAMKKAGILGVGQSGVAEDFNDALDDLNDMVAQWQRKRWLVYHLVDVSVLSTGAVSYTVGTGGNIDIPRPDRIEAAFLRQIVPSQPSLVDYPLEILESREDYNMIALKTLGAFSKYAFYDAAFPLGNLFFWPVPQASIYSLHISLKQQLANFPTLTTAFALPPEYGAAIQWNLAQRLRASYRLPADQEINGLAKDALNLIRNANAQVPRLRVPLDLVRPGLYDVYSDQIR